LSFEYPKNVRFQCTKCALCCGDTKKRARHILLLKKETERISEAAFKPVEEFAVQIEGREPYVYEMKKTKEEGKCLFLKENICTIYASRPLICKFYPFQLRTTKDGRHRFSHTRECQGIGKGKLVGKSYLERLFQQAHEQLMEEATKAV
jgi:Fe-S-cluster containining protein